MYCPNRLRTTTRYSNIYAILTAFKPYFNERDNIPHIWGNSVSIDCNWCSSDFESENLFIKFPSEHYYTCLGCHRN